jgi:hypothetical protein
MRSITVLAAIELRIRFLVLLISWIYIYIIKAAIELRLLVLVLLLYFVDTIGAAIEGTRDNNRTSITLIAAVGLRIRFLKVERTRNDMPGIKRSCNRMRILLFLYFVAVLVFVVMLLSFVVSLRNKLRCVLREQTEYFVVVVLCRKTSYRRKIGHDRFASFTKNQVF